MARAKKTKVHIAGYWGGSECGNVRVADFTRRQIRDLSLEEIQERLDGRSMCKTCLRCLRVRVRREWQDADDDTHEKLKALEEAQ